MDSNHSIMDKPLTIAHLIATNFYGGPEKQIASHALKLNSMQFKFILYSFIEYGNPNELIEVARANGNDVVQFITRNPFNPRSIKLVSDALKHNRVDLLCVHGYKSNVIGRLASWMAGIPLLSISRGWTAENSRISLYEKLDRLFLHFADHIVAVSHGQKEKIIKHGILKDKISVIHNAINLKLETTSVEPSLRQTLGLPENALIIASAGRLSPEKNYSAMINVAKRLGNKFTNAYFVIFGEGFLRHELESEIREQGLSSRFLLPGFRKDLLNILPEIDIFMLPSFTEGLPNVALEAFAHKKPIIATAVGGTPEVVQHEVSGYLTAPENYAAMSDFLEKLISDAELRKKMGNAGYEYIKENFGFEMQTKKYEELYTKIVKSRIKK